MDTGKHYQGQERGLLWKRPFRRITPFHHNAEEPAWKVMTQADMLREYFPSGHKINDPQYYHNLVKYDQEKKEFFTQEVFRVAVPLQKIITTQQLVHLTGNDIHLELSDSETTKEKQELMRQLQQGWLDKGMERLFYQLCKSVKITGDGAIAFFMQEGKLKAKSLSYLNGDTLYPHYDDNGELCTFIRKYMGRDNGMYETTFIEVWDCHTFRRYKSYNAYSVHGDSVNVSTKGIPEIPGYRLIESHTHPFPYVPVVYHREDSGPCWSFSQDNIDKYELALSALCQNNMAYAFPIMVLRGDDIQINGDIYGNVKAITMGSDDHAEYLSAPQEAENFRLQLDTLLRMIFMGSFTVLPPEVKGGNLPGVTIKLLYSPSIEKAMTDAKAFEISIEKMCRLFQHGYGIEQKALHLYTNLHVISWIEPYIHQNTAELVSSLCNLANSGIISRQTASEHSTFASNDEWQRIKTESKGAANQTD
ncbi:MAG: phage portal protein [Prevotella sp.]|nr:phage portal protein [Prevotella sp.]